MAVNREILNNQLVAYAPVHTGVYQDAYRHTCVVVRVREGKIHYMTFFDCTVQLHESFTEKFLREWPLELYQYSALRALRKFAHYIEQGFSATPEARTVLRSILKG
jgi:hypothetical protein